MMESTRRLRKFCCYSPNCRGKEVSQASFYRHKKRREMLDDFGSEEVIGQEVVGQEVVAEEEFLDDSVAEEVLRGAKVVLEEVGS